MRKLVIAKITPDSLITCNSAVKKEVKKLDYVGNVIYENGVYHIIGKKQITVFVKNMTEVIKECEKVFVDAEANRGFQKDLDFLASLKKLKAE